MANESTLKATIHEIVPTGEVGAYTVGESVTLGRKDSQKDAEHGYVVSVHSGLFENVLVPDYHTAYAMKTLIDNAIYCAYHQGREEYQNAVR